MHFGSGSFRHLIHRLPLGHRDAAYLAATFLTADFLAADFLVVVVFADAFLAVAFLAVDALAGDFLGSVPSGLVFFLSRAGSILAAPAPGANKLSCASFHRTRYWDPKVAFDHLDDLPLPGRPADSPRLGRDGLPFQVQDVGSDTRHAMMRT